MQKKHPWHKPVDMHTQLSMRNYVDPATSQAVDAAYRLDALLPGDGRD